MLLWNSRDRVRALRTQYPATRSARGRSFGPIKTSATTPISSNSDQPMSKSMGNEQPCVQIRLCGASDILRKGRHRQSQPLAAGRTTAVSYPTPDLEAAFALPGLGPITAAADGHEPALGIRDIDIDDRDSAARAPHCRGGHQARGCRGQAR